MLVNGQQIDSVMVIDQPFVVDRTSAITVPATLAAGATFSAVFTTQAFPHVAVAAMLNKSGVMTLQPCLDKAGLVPNGSSATVALVANTPDIIDLVPSAVFQSCVLSITNEDITTATLSAVAVLLQSSAEGGSGGWLGATAVALGTVTSGARMIASAAIPAAAAGLMTPNASMRSVTNPASGAGVGLASPYASMRSVTNPASAAGTGSVHATPT